MGGALLPVVSAYIKANNYDEAASLLDLIGWERAKNDLTFNAVKQSLKQTLGLSYCPGRLKGFFQSRVASYLRFNLLLDSDIEFVAVVYLNNLKRQSVRLSEIKEDALLLGRGDFAIEADSFEEQCARVYESFDLMKNYRRGQSLEISDHLLEVREFALALEWYGPATGTVPIQTSQLLSDCKELAEAAVLNLLDSDAFIEEPSTVDLLVPLLDFYSDEDFLSSDRLFSSVRELIDRVPEDFEYSCDLVAGLYLILTEERRAELRSSSSFKRVWSRRLQALCLELAQKPQGAIESTEQADRESLLSEIAEVLYLIDPKKIEMGTRNEQNNAITKAYAELQNQEKDRLEAIKKIREILETEEPVFQDLLRPLMGIDTRSAPYCNLGVRVDVEDLFESLRSYHVRCNSGSRDPGELASVLEDIEIALRDENTACSLQGVSQKDLLHCAAKVAFERRKVQEEIREPESNPISTYITNRLYQARTLNNWGDPRAAVGICNELLSENSSTGEQGGDSLGEGDLAKILFLRASLFENLYEPLEAARSYFRLGKLPGYRNGQREDQQWSRSCLFSAGYLYLNPAWLLQEESEPLIAIEAEYSLALKALEEAHQVHLELVREAALSGDDPNITTGSYELIDFQWALPMYLGLALKKEGRGDEGESLINKTLAEIEPISRLGGGLSRGSKISYADRRRNLESFDQLVGQVCQAFEDHDEPLFAAEVSEGYFELLLKEIASWSDREIEPKLGSPEEVVISALPWALRATIEYTSSYRSQFNIIEKVRPTEELLQAFRGIVCVDQVIRKLGEIRGNTILNKLV